MGKTATSFRLGVAKRKEAKAFLTPQSAIADSPLLGSTAAFGRRAEALMSLRSGQTKSTGLINHFFRSSYFCSETVFLLIAYPFSIYRLRTLDAHCLNLVALIELIRYPIDMMASRL